jgi:hypothetical protein
MLVIFFRDAAGGLLHPSRFLFSESVNAIVEVPRVPNPDPS